jgi:hypothetical protein
MCDIVMEMTVNEQWALDKDGGIQYSLGVTDDQGEFADYACLDCGEYFETWERAKAHRDCEEAA